MLRTLRTSSCAPGARSERIGLNAVAMTKRGTRPPRGDIDAAALELLRRHGAQILATARRYAVTAEDAEDAYQRGIEILLTKAPSTREDELIPWLKTVVKHEAFALRRQRDRHSPVTDDGELRDRPAPTAVTHEQAERLERLRQGAEALAHLKPHEIRALVLKAEGFSYREICAMTGWSYTKVNRLLTEGRRAFLRRVSGIQRGAECARYEPLLSALADGEASADDLERLRPHMRTCLSCRAALREYRATPGRVAGALPPVGVAVDSPLRGFLESLVGAAQQKSALVGERLQAATEIASAQKVAAVAASAAALAGGGTALDELANHRGPPQGAEVQQENDGSVKEEVSVEVAPTPPPPPEVPAEPEPPAAPAEPPPAEPPAPEPDPANEFMPAAASESAPASAAPPEQGPVAPAGGGSRSGGSAEFAP